VRALLADLHWSEEAGRGVDARARRLVEAVRARRLGEGLDAFLHAYGLSTQEGVLLMCIAEALLRIPDEGTRERLIRDKLAAADWERHLGRSSSVLVNASTWALMLTGRLVRLHDEAGHGVAAAMRSSRGNRSHMRPLSFMRLRGRLENNTVLACAGYLSLSVPQNKKAQVRW
jgi:RHH-type proline utilization regulon transcriptional repressor/proline dehydrogenase/delta 1-pyrroline-5-carboxylate dehydrogenase